MGRLDRFCLRLIVRGRLLAGSLVGAVQNDKGARQGPSCRGTLAGLSATGSFLGSLDDLGVAVVNDPQFVSDPDFLSLYLSSSIGLVTFRAIGASVLRSLRVISAPLPWILIPVTVPIILMVPAKAEVLHANRTNITTNVLSFFINSSCGKPHLVRPGKMRLKLSVAGAVAKNRLR